MASECDARHIGLNFPYSARPLVFASFSECHPMSAQRSSSSTRSAAIIVCTIDRRGLPRAMVQPEVQRFAPCGSGATSAPPTCSIVYPPKDSFRSPDLGPPAAMRMRVHTPPERWATS